MLYTQHPRIPHSFAYTTINNDLVYVEANRGEICNIFILQQIIVSLYLANSVDNVLNEVGLFRKLSLFHIRQRIRVV